VQRCWTVSRCCAGAAAGSLATLQVIGQQQSQG
jgi:hypothetical protein